MVNLFGVDIQSGLDAIGNATKDMLESVRVGGSDPFAAVAQRPADPFAGLTYGSGTLLAGLSDEHRNSMFALDGQGRDPFGTAYSGAGESINLANSYKPAFAAFDVANNTFQANQARDKAEQDPKNATQGKPSTKSTAGAGGDFGGGSTPGTADNETLTGAAIDGYISRTRPGSPLAGMGQFILDTANQQGVSVPQLLGIMTLESGLGTEQGTLPGVFNYGGLTGTGWAGQTGNTTGMARAFATFASKEDGVRALIANLASSAYKGKTIQQQTGLWYLGDENAGLDQTDENKNASMREYLATIGGAYQGLGVPFDPNAAPRAATPRAGGGGGRIAANGYAFPVVGYTGAIGAHHDDPSARGGTDLMAPRGTPIVAMRGGTVTSTAQDGLGGNTVMIHGDDGKDYYYAHMDAPTVVALGARVATGTPLGVVGDSGNAKGTGTHLHIGIGYGIQEGAGSQGGLGSDYDGVTLLQQTWGSP